MSKYSASIIAEWFLAYDKSRSFDGSEGITNLKLQKLLYYAQGAHLAIHGEALFDEDFYAWTYGPVIPSLYSKYANGSAILEADPDFNFISVSEDDAQLLTEVYNEFGQYSAWKLVAMTHSEAPWKETALNGVMSKPLISEYFKDNYVE